MYKLITHASIVAMPCALSQMNCAQAITGCLIL